MADYKQTYRSMSLLQFEIALFKPRTLRLLQNQRTHTRIKLQMQFVKMELSSNSQCGTSHSCQCRCFIIHKCCCETWKGDCNVVLTCRAIGRCLTIIALDGPLLSPFEDKKKCRAFSSFPRIQLNEKLIRFCYTISLSLRSCTMGWPCYYGKHLTIKGTSVRRPVARAAAKCLNKDDNLCHPRVSFVTLSVYVPTLCQMCDTQVAQNGWRVVNYKLATVLAVAMSAKFWSENP